MIGLSALWLPILLSSATVFVVSFVLHMALPWHKDDYSKVPMRDELCLLSTIFAKLSNFRIDSDTAQTARASS